MATNSERASLLCSVGDLRLCFLIVLLDGFDTAAIGYIAPSLIAEWGVAKGDLAPVLSAALFGLAGGAMCSGPLADKFGRKAVLVGSVLVFAVACLASGYTHDLTNMTAWRFVTGLGLGAAMPNAVTLMSEYCPESRRATITNAMFCGFPLGAAFGGFLAAWMIPHFGWRSVLYLGGIAPLLLLVLCFAAARVCALPGGQGLLGRPLRKLGAHCGNRRGELQEVCDDRDKVLLKARRMGVVLSSVRVGRSWL